VNRPCTLSLRYLYAHGHHQIQLTRAPRTASDPSRSHGTYIMSPQPAEFGWRFLSGRVEGTKKKNAVHLIQLLHGSSSPALTDFADVATRTAAAKFWGCVLFSTPVRRRWAVDSWAGLEMATGTQSPISRGEFLY
jgi:hypothetical protein